VEERHPVDAERLAASDVRFFVARRGGTAVGCAGLLMSAPTGEIKRMFVTGEARGLGIGQALLDTLEKAAAAEGIALLKLETGPRNAAALALYSASGYEPCSAFPPYRPSPHSVFMEKPLAVG
jgi:putative acetyltransferase